MIVRMEVMEKEFLKHLSKYMDFSCVQAQDTKADIEEMVRAAKRFGPAAVFSLPCYTPYLAKWMQELPSVVLGGVVGFPSGAQSTAVKRQEAAELLALGCRELDMVLAVGRLKDRDIAYVEQDIRAVVETAGEVPVKVIVEAGYLTAEELVLACKAAVRAGARFVKSGTGWSGIPSTAEMIRCMKRAVGDRAKIKAAGGIRTLDAVVQMHKAGCDRFGISTASAARILEEAETVLGKQAF